MKIPNLYKLLLPPPGYRKTAAALLLSVFVFAAFFFTDKLPAEELGKWLGGIWVTFTAGNIGEHVGQGRGL